MFSTLVIVKNSELQQYNEVVGDIEEYMTEQLVHKLEEMRKL